MFRVVETFSGIGSQAKALERIGVDHEIVYSSEWDINAIIAYYFIHSKNIKLDKYNDVDNEEIIKFLKNIILSSDGKVPMKERTLKNLPMEMKRLLYTAIRETNNLGSITGIKGVDMPEDIDLFTYSFPCQDLSLCGSWHGNTTGISRDIENRSGMLWEVERILIEMKDKNISLPKFLLMENVTNILSKTHKNDFDSWKSNLQELGYYNKIYRLNSSNFGVPQRRNRAYMISILCNGNEKLIKSLDEFFLTHDLEGAEADKMKSRNLHLRDILCLDYSESKYKHEAEKSRPNNTPSRVKIFNDNVLLYNGEHVKDICVGTVTTKQDRNPNSGVISYRKEEDGKAGWRYLTPRECFKLMGFDEDDFDKIIDNNPKANRSRNLFSTEKMIKFAGNSIVVDVLEGIFKQIIQIDKEILNKNNY